MSNLKIEQRSIIVSIFGTLGMGGLGVLFAALTGSQAILLDGLFSLIGLAMGIITLKVAKLVRLPDSEQYPFGYALFEPLLNLSKGLIMGFLSIFAFYSAVDAVLSGGRSIDAGSAMLYALVAALGCLVLYLYQRRLFKKSSSPIVEVDAKNWLMDGAVSGAVLIAFMVAWFMDTPRWQPYLPYVDPVVMILLILLTLYIPFRIAKVNLAELLLAAPEPETIRELEKRISPLLKNPSFEDHYARATKVGRTLYVHLYIVLTEGVSDWQTVSEQDRFRTHVFETLSKSIENVALDVIFTEDPCWAAGSVSKAPARS